MAQSLRFKLHSLPNRAACLALSFFLLLGATIAFPVAHVKVKVLAIPIAGPLAGWTVVEIGALINTILIGSGMVFEHNSKNAFLEHFKDVPGLPLDEFVKSILPKFPSIHVQNDTLVIESDTPNLDPSLLTEEWVNAWVSVYDYVKDGTHDIFGWGEQISPTYGKTLDALCNPITDVQAFDYVASPEVVSYSDFVSTIFPAFVAGTGLISGGTDPSTFSNYIGYYYLLSGYGTYYVNGYYFSNVFVGLGYSPDSKTAKMTQVTYEKRHYSGSASPDFDYLYFTGENGYYYAGSNSEKRITSSQVYDRPAPVPFSRTSGSAYFPVYRVTGGDRTFQSVFTVPLCYYTVPSLSAAPAAPADIITDYYNANIYTDADRPITLPPIEVPSIPDVTFPDTPGNIDTLNALKNWLAQLAAGFASAIDFMAADMAAIVGHFTFINTKVDALADNLTAVGNDVTAVGTAVTGVGQAVGGLQGSIDDVNRKVGGLQGSIDNVGAAVGGLQGSIDDVAGRVGGVESALGGLQGSIDDVGATVGGLAGDVYDVKEKVGGLQGSIDNVGTAVGGLQGSIDNVGQRVGGLENGLADVNGNIGALADSIPGTVSGAMTAAIGEADVTLDAFRLRPLILQKFPFCIPFDMADFVGTFLAAPKAPKFAFDLRPTKIGEFGGEAALITLVDFGDPMWDGIVKIFRFSSFALFTVGLMTLTSRVIKW